MTHRLACLILMTLAGCAAFEGEEEPVSSATFHVGQRKFKEDWAPVDDQTAAGIQFERQDPTALVGYELGFFVSAENDKHLADPTDNLGDEDAEASSVVADLSAGLRKTFSNQGAHLYFGAGLALIYADVEVDPPHSSTEDDSETSLGFYGHTGVYWEVHKASRLGVDYRVLTGADDDLDYVGNADSSIVSLFFGYSF